MFYLDHVPSTTRRSRPPSSHSELSAPSPLPSLGSMAHADRGIRTPTSGSISPQHSQQPCSRSTSRRNDPLPRVPRQQPVDQPPARPHDLARHLDHRRAERRELHPQQRPLLGLVLGRVPRRHRQQQRAPRLQAPGQADAITMYAQLLTRSSTGVVSACTPLLSWAIRFSWSQRSLAENTISSAGMSRSLVM